MKGFFAILGGVAIAFSLAVGAIAAFVFRETEGSGIIVAESRTVDDFDRVAVCCGIQLQVTQSSPISLQLEGDDNVLAEIVTSVRGRTLTIGYRRKFASFRPTHPVVARVTLPEVSGLTVSGGGRLETTALDSAQLEIGLSGGSAGLISELRADELSTKLSGGAQMEIAGTTTHQSLSSSGGSGFNAGRLQSQRADIDVSGGGTCTIWVEEQLEINGSGGSSITYYGSANISQNTTGGSKVNFAGERPE